VALALEMGISTMTYAVSAGPLKERTVQAQVREVLNEMDVVTVRERRAQRILEDIGVDREIIVTADPAVLLEPEPITKDMLTHEHILVDGGRRIIGMSVREPGVAAPELDEKFYHALLANAADYMVDRYNADIIFMPMERRMLDLQHSHAVVSKMLRPQRASVMKGNYTSGQLLSFMKHFDFAVGMRLHFLIFAAVQGIPFVGLPYSEKVLGFLHDLEIQMPPIQLVNAGRLLAHIDYFWDQKETFQDSIERLLSKLQERARRTNEIAVNLLTGKLKKAAPKRRCRKEPKKRGVADACAHTSQSTC
jgi:polysaccharide pyruvyl transferase WcaK-like protein